jgi:hypothetical protein
MASRTLGESMTELDRACREFGAAIEKTALWRAIVAATEHLDRWLTRGHSPDG